MTSFLFLASFLYYLSGLSGSIPAYRDSGDLIASIHTLGIAHPPGYALYVLVGKLFVTLLPFGNIPYRVNVMSALFASLTVVFLYRFLRRLSNENSFLPLVLSVLFLASPAMTMLARVAEMYTFSAFLAIAIVTCAFSEHPRGTLWAALLLGLGLSVHPTLIFLLPVFMVHKGRVFTQVTILGFLAGLLVFLYLPIRAAQDPLQNWGDPSQWRNFWRVITRADYGGLKLHPEQSVLAWTAASIKMQLLNFVRMFQGEWGGVALAVGVWGIVRVSGDPLNRSRGFWLLTAWLLAGPGFFLLSNLPLAEKTTPAILQPYLILAGVLWAPFVFWGMLALVRSWVHVRSIPATVIFLLLLAKPWAWTSQRHDFFAYDYASNLLNALPPGAVLYEPDDPTHFAIRTLQVTENRRPDVTLLNFFRTRWGYEQIKRRSPDLLPPIPIPNAQVLQATFWNYSAKKRPFFAELPQKLGQIPYRSQGLAYRAMIDVFPVDETKMRDVAEWNLAHLIRRGTYRTTAHYDFFTRQVLGYYAAAYCNLGLAFAEVQDFAKATHYYQAALEIDPELTAAWNNLGSVAYGQGHFAQARDYFMRGLEFDPKNEMLQKNAQLALQGLQKNSKRL